MKKSRRSQLLQHIAEITSIAIANKEYTGINTDAFTISLDLNLDRANVSRMLNDLWRENILIKIQGRPTFYLHRKTLLKRYPNSYIPALIPKNEELATYLEHSLVLSQETAKEAFTSCIGHSIRESMYPIIEDIKVFLTYPQTMRSIMICGPHKSGKHHLLRCIMQYLKIDTEQLLHIDCAAIALGKLTISDIMQRIDTSLDQEKSNIILFENLDALTELPASITTMETLLRFYQRMAESNELNLLFLAVTAMNEHFLQLQKLFQKVYELPDLNSRTLKEKYEFVLHFMQNEADAIGKTISLSSSILNCFATACYPGNLQNLKQELRNAAKLEINQLYSLSLQKIRDCIQQVLDKHAFTIQEKQLDKLCIRINNLFSILKHHSYSTAFVPDMDMQDTAIQLLCEEICEALKQTFDRKLPDMEQLFMYCYLLYSREHHIKGSIAVLVACQGEGIAEKYATHVNTMKYQVKCRYIDETGTASTRNLTAFLSTVVDKVREIDEGSGVVIITDFNPLLDFDSEIRSSTDIETVTLSPTSLPLLIQVMNMVNNPSIQLEDIRNYDYGTALQIPQSDSTGYGIEIQKTLDDVADKILSESLVFLNPKKATMALFRVLMKIYEDLGLNYTDEISIRFIFHSAFMIERVIRREPLIYKNTNSIISTNREVYTSIDRNMELVNDVFGISIPSSEIARLSEIFVDLINGCEQEECRTGID